MRKENLKRLNGTDVPKDRPDYIVMHYLMRDLETAIDGFSRGKLLDVGCGNKPYEQLFAGKVESYVGCDVVQSDREKADVICEAAALSFEDHVFDTVFSTQVIEHVADPLMMLKEIHRVLKSEGVLIFSAPFCWELHEEPHDYFRFSKYGLHEMLDRRGFEVLDIKSNGGKWAAVFQMNLNILYSAFKGKGLSTKILKRLFFFLKLTALINGFALWMDKKYSSDLLTLNYVVVARKAGLKANQGRAGAALIPDMNGCRSQR